MTPETMIARPLFGRDRELAALQTTHDEVISGRTRLVTLVGEAGIGKTRLCDEFSTLAQAQGTRSIWGRAWQSADAPAFWPWRQIMEELKPGNTLFSTPVDGFDLYEAVAAFVKRCTEEAPLMLVFDDLHVADPSSIRLLDFIARSIRDVPLLLLVIIRDFEVTLDPDVRAALEELRREATSIALGPLTEEDVARAIEARIGERPLPGLVRSALNASQGNPMFLNEVIAVLQKQLDIHRPDGSTGFIVPAGAKDVLTKRLQVLDEGTRSLLHQAAVIGREFPAQMLADLAGIQREQALANLVEASKVGIVRESGALGSYAFTHVLLREFLYEQLSPADRMRSHYKVATWLEHRFGDDPDDLGDLAHHYFKAAQAGDPAKSVVYLRRAGEEAFRIGANEDAARYLRRALLAAALAGASTEEKEELRATLARCLDPVPSQVSRHPNTGSLQREGEYWTLTYGDAIVRLKDRKGVRHLAELLTHPGREFLALDLAAAGHEVKLDGSSNETPRGAEGGLEPLDEGAARTYRRRLTALQGEMEDADGIGDSDRVAKAREEMDFLTRELAAGIGLGGRVRTSRSPSERARFAVSKAVRSTISKIAETSPALGSHLTATVRTGTYCAYDPDPRLAVRWELRR